jgi:cytochrome P450
VFAQMELKVVLAMMLQRHRLKLTPNQKLDYISVPTLAFKDSLHMSIGKTSETFAPRVAVQGHVDEIVQLH